MGIAVADAYHWAVIYQDGTFLQEFDEVNTIGRGFTEVGEKPVKEFKLESPDQALRSHYVEVPDGATPVFFRRRKVALDPMDGSEQGRETVHCIGWKRDEAGVYLFVSEDGSTLLTDNLAAV